MASVTLLEYTPEPDLIVASAARLCYSNDDPTKLLEGMTPTRAGKLISDLKKSGHMSPFEHVSFTFSVDGISRACSHQLVRHRVGTAFSQRSQRYVKVDEPEFVVPKTVRENPEALSKFNAAAHTALIMYRLLLDLDIPAEDARYVLPNATPTSLVMTMNARELLHFLNVRLCNRAQWEIRHIAFLMLEAVREVAPLLFDEAGPNCVSENRCVESHPCDSPGFIKQDW